MHVFGSVGAMYLVLMSYLFRDWQKVEISMAVPCVIFIFYIWYDLINTNLTSSSLPLASFNKQ